MIMAVLSLFRSDQESLALMVNRVLPAAQAMEAGKRGYSAVGPHTLAGADLPDERAGRESSSAQL